MAKTIKFNLIMDGKYPVRNIEGLQEHFCIEDVLRYYANGILQRWLANRGYEKELEQVNKIDPAEDHLKVMRKLIKIFQIEADKKKVEYALMVFRDMEERIARESEQAKNSFERNRVIKDYHDGFKALLEHMLENKDDMNALKADARKMEDEYLDLFLLNPRYVFNTFDSIQAYKAVYAMLTREKLNKVIVENNFAKDYCKIPYDIEEDFIKVRKNTQGMWDNIEPNEVSVLVISVSSGAFVKNIDSFDEKIGRETNGFFLILDGLAFQSNSSNADVYYLVV